MTPALDLAAAFHVRWLAVLEAYLDESQGAAGNGARTWVIAGWLGDSTAWRDFEGKWQLVVGRARPRIKEFHAADCEGGHNDFKGWSRRKRWNLKQRLISVIQESAIEHVAIQLLSVGPVRKHADYLNCAVPCMLGLTALTHAKGYRRGERIAFIFDEKDKIKGSMEELRKSMRGLKRKQISSRIGPLTFDDSKLVLPLQAADLLAYEVFRSLSGGKTDELKLLEGQCGRYLGLFWNGAKGHLMMFGRRGWIIVPEHHLAPFSPIVQHQGSPRRPIPPPPGIS